MRSYNRIGRKSVPEIIHRAAVVGANSFVGHVNAEKDLNVVFQVVFCGWVSPPKLGVNTGSFLDVGGSLRKESLCHYYSP
jgi:hypothetical protein